METVLHLVSGDETEQETTFDIARTLLDDGSGTVDEVAVVAQSEGIETPATDGQYGDRVRSLRGDDVETVPEGAVEMTRLESEGDAYMQP